MKHRMVKYMTLCVCMIMLGGCIGRNSAHTPLQSNQTMVRAGDTLHTIAARHNTSAEAIAKLNNISNSSLHPGQIIFIPESPDHFYATQEVKPEVKTIKMNKVEKPSNTKKVMARHWPINGKVVKKYSAGPERFDGIEIAGTRGEDVLPAMSGFVIFSGKNSTLQHLGNIVVIEHDDAYVTVYGNLLSTEIDDGRYVKCDKVIGKTAGNLYFEVRKDGSKINPQDILPRAHN